ncbi:MAG: SGNH/GDSL hydrolase family protein [Candidatus Dadabacteria bacterium]|nr:SGNH/GDSL hydrolase family protein [Candidatus Dadabacteria bacterium]
MKLKKIALLTLSLIVSLILLELGLRFVVPHLINLAYTNTIYDDKLGHRINKSLYGIDENGFRNPKILEQVDIAVLGDSHTYGVNASLENSWPQQLAKMANSSVYNFGVNGYGGLQYDYLMEEAINLRPKHIIIGLYLANDLYDVCKLINKLRYWQVRLKELGYKVEDCIPSSNSSSILKQTLSKLHLRQPLSKLHLSSLSAYSFRKIYKRLYLRDTIDIKEDTFLTITNNKRIASLKRNMDIGRERIRLGFEITKDIIEDSNRKANLNNTEFSVVFIPSKERVFFDYLNERGYQLPIYYNELVDNEVKLIEMFSNSFKKQGIKFVDAKPYVEKQIYNSKPVYKPSDAHPLRAGYKAYATAAFDCIIKENKSTYEQYCNKGPTERRAFVEEE